MHWLLVTALALGMAGAADTDAPVTAPIHLDVSVRDARGRTPDKLSAADFKVTDGGAPLPVISARFVGPPPATPRVFAFFLDQYHVDAEAAVRARDLLTAFVRDEVRAGDQMIVLKPLDSLLALPLTSDRETVLAEIASFEGRLRNYEPRSPLEREVVAGAPERADAMRAQITISALHALTTHLSQLPASRKALVVVSDGFAVRPVRRSGTLLPTIDAVVRAANRSNVAIYPVSGAIGADPSDGTALLLRLARETDGRVTEPAADGLRRLADDMSGYYLLEVAPTADGRFHPVSVQAGASGLTVRMRPGFWAASAEDLARARRAAEPLPPPPPMLPALRSSRLIRPWVGQSRAAEGLTRLTLVWEAAPAGSGERTAAVTPSRLRVKALNQDGTAVFEGVVAAATHGTAANGTQAVFDVPPGRIRLQMSVEDTAARELDTDVRDVLVLPLAGPVAFGTPAVYRARTARAFNELVDDTTAAPSAGREFSRDERLLIRLPVYGDDTTAVRAALTSRGGQTMRTLAVTRVARTPDRTIDVPLTGLAAGEYGVVIIAREDEREARETIQFRITP